MHSRFCQRSKYRKCVSYFSDDTMCYTNSTDILISDLEFNIDGTEVWISCKDSHVTVIETNQWHVIKNVFAEQFYIKTLNLLSTEFNRKISHVELRSLFIGITNDHMLAFLSEEFSKNTFDIIPFMPHGCSAVKRLTNSPDFKMIAVLLENGIFQIYTTESLVNQVYQTILPECTPLEQSCLDVEGKLKGFHQRVS